MKEMGVRAPYPETHSKMDSSKRLDRKQFLTWGLATASSALVFGCSDDGGTVPGAGGAPGGAGMPTAGSGGTPGASGSFNTAGSSNGGAAGNAGATPGGAGSGGTSGGAGGSGGMSGGAGGAGGMPAVTPDCGTKLKVLITSDHGHKLDIPLADVMAAMPKAYDTKGTSMHSHWVQLTAADFTKLQTGGTVRKISCNDGHEHEFIINCIGVEKPETTSGIAAFCEADKTCAETDMHFCTGPT